MYSCCCSLLVRIFKHLDTGYGKFKPISALRIRHVPVLRLRLRLRFLNCFFRSVLLPNFSIIMERELLIMGVQQPEYIFIVVRTNECYWLGTEDLSAERRRPGDYCT